MKNITILLAILAMLVLSIVAASCRTTRVVKTVYEVADTPSVVININD